MKFRHDHAGTDGAEAIGWLADATPVEQQIVRCVRLWMTGADDREAMWNVLAADLGTQEARRVLRAFEAFIASIAVSIERKINRHALDCPCICRDEAALLEIVRQAGRGDGFRAAAHAAVLVRKDRVAAVVDAADGLASEIARGGGYLNQGPTWRGPEPAGGTLH